LEDATAQVAGSRSLPAAEAAGMLGHHLTGAAHDDPISIGAHVRLVIAAIALWNTSYRQRAVEHLRALEVAATEALLAHLSPMDWAHVGLTRGRFFRADAAAAGGFGPLTDPADRLYRVT
jgi:hypothetical protein